MSVECDCGNTTFRIGVTFEREDGGLSIKGWATCDECDESFPIAQDGNGPVRVEGDLSDEDVGHIIQNVESYFGGLGGL